MANVVQITQLPTVPSLNGTEALEAVQAGVSVQITAAQIAALAGGGGGGPVVWTTITTDYIAVVGGMYNADTTGGPFTLTFPANPARLATVEVRDLLDTWTTHALTIDPGPAGIAQDPDPTLTCQVSTRMVFVFNGTTWVINEEVALNTFIPA